MENSTTSLTSHCRLRFWYVLLLGLVLCILRSFSAGNGGWFTNHAGLFCGGDQNPEFFVGTESNQTSDKDTKIDGTVVDGHDSDSCSGKYIYIHDLPARFNDGIIKNCDKLSIWRSMCDAMLNLGLGPPANNSGGILQDKGWFQTNQFVLEIIFRHRMKQYKCLTNDSSRASAVYVPFYAGFEVSRHLVGYNTTIRDAAAVDLVNWLSKRPEWRTMWGRDHFFSAGRITWDFGRSAHADSNWGSKLLSLPETQNMTMLAIESSPWRKNDFAVPYPTYFHPSNDGEIFDWQRKVSETERKYLFAFVGAPRPGISDSGRAEIIRQCLASGEKCKLLDCRGINCYDPTPVMTLFQSSIFCLQPPGDSYTRRSAFDSMLAGCIPVFFHPGTAYVQYIWHLPKDYSKYSVFIPEHDIRERNASIEKILLGFSKKKVEAMRKEVIKLIPKIIYADPRSRLETVEDAFDLTVKNVLERVEKIRGDMKEGRNFEADFPQSKSWKYYLFGNVEESEWDSFFAHPYNVGKKKGWKEGKN